ncbi:hypothetical protein H6F95_19345 [Cyanobacteria bacterium FACHB-471]|nr:hypothetical protein [Cyanobacteria bacterium FACHB-471]
MTVKEQLIQEIEQAPESLVEEVLNFLLFTKTRSTQRTTQTNSPSSGESVATSEETIEQSNLSLLNFVESLVSDIPSESLEKLPHDGAAQHDHYLYGLPKREA